jgi:hypothetical protein
MAEGGGELEAEESTVAAAEAAAAADEAEADERGKRSNMLSKGDAMTDGVCVGMYTVNRNTERARRA